ncbi:hypothetical protein DAPPUDRAFT_335234 [Daphnia pulex]|uniref:Uncharacterized protein n=1 Tax=Daphnia pulex TaxID=6669 RepID=E9HX83_DAPPU|nr:hypothetical protein DAPPUDRAFT_335234 [Daphnia pulex]|eukprot:EFX63645.1 hypothetical protein DAPPUDRAFT_335234 [Daphnia pulex]
MLITNKDVVGESDAALSKPRPPLTPAKKSPAKDNVDNQYQLPTSSSTENIKSDKNKCVEKPIEIRKAVPKRKLAGGSVEVDRSMLTMGYFIKNNPADGKKLQNALEKLHMRKIPFEVAELSKKSQAVLHAQSTRNAILDDRLAEEDVMIRIEGNQDNEEEGSAMPVPQVCLGLHGEIILDEKSLTRQASIGQITTRITASHPSSTALTTTDITASLPSHASTARPNTLQTTLAIVTSREASSALVQRTTIQLSSTPNADSAFKTIELQPPSSPSPIEEENEEQLSMAFSIQ